MVPRKELSSTSRQGPLTGAESDVSPADGVVCTVRWYDGALTCSPATTRGCAGPDHCASTACMARDPFDALRRERVPSCSRPVQARDEAAPCRTGLWRWPPRPSAIAIRWCESSKRAACQGVGTVRFHVVALSGRVAARSRPMQGSWHWYFPGCHDPSRVGCVRVAEAVPVCSSSGDGGGGNP